jgi:hypothetical protein
LHRVFDRYAALCCPVLDVFGQSYHWSLMQVEYATDLIFRSAATLKPLYEQLARESVLSVKAEQIATFLGRQITSQLAQEVGSRFSTRIEGTRIKRRFGASSIKMYDKLRILVIMNTRTSQPEQVLASGMRSCWFVATDGCPVSSFPFGRQAVSAPCNAFSRAAPDSSGTIGYQSRAKPRGGTTAWSSVRSSSAMALTASAVVVSRNPSGKASNQAVYSACSASSSATAVPALWPGAPVGRPPIANPDDRGRVIDFVARAVARLSFGVTEGGLTFGLAASWRGLFSVTVTQFKGRTRVTWRPGTGKSSSGGGLVAAFSRRTDGVALA